MRTITPYGAADLPVIFEIINESAIAYRGVIPADRWHEPYMPLAESVVLVSPQWQKDATSH